MAQNSKVDMSLDDIIKIDNIRLPKNGGGGGNRGNNFRNNNRRTDFRGGDGFQGNFNRNRQFNNRTGFRGLYTHHAKRLQNNGPRRFEGGFGAGFGGGLSAHARLGSNDRNTITGRFHHILHISNLSATVSSEDLEELFSSFGPVVRSAVHYDQYGTCIGTAEITFEQREEAAEAMQKLNNVPLDGKPMKIKLIGLEDDDDPFSQSLRRATNPFQRNNNYQNYRSNDNQRRQNYRNGNNNNNNRNNRNENLSVDDLDKEMDEWRQQQDPKQPSSVGDFNPDDTLEPIAEYEMTE